MTKSELQDRTKQFAVRVIKMVRHLPQDPAGQVVARQIIRSATSIGANYRAACRARSRAEFSAKLGIVLEEADETLYWLEIIRESGLLPASKLSSLMVESNELTAIFATSKKTLDQQQNQKSPIKHQK